MVVDISEVPVLVLIALPTLTSLNWTPDVLDYNDKLNIRQTSQPIARFWFCILDFDSTPDELIQIIEPPVARFWFCILDRWEDWCSTCFSFWVMLTWALRTHVKDSTNSKYLLRKNNFQFFEK